MNQFDYFKMITGHALIAFEEGNVRRAHEILLAGSAGEAIAEDPKQRTLDYCEYRQGWPLTETGARS